MLLNAFQMLVEQLTAAGSNKVLLVRIKVVCEFRRTETLTLPGTKVTLWTYFIVKLNKKCCVFVCLCVIPCTFRNTSGCCCCVVALWVDFWPDPFTEIAAVDCPCARTLGRLLSGFEHYLHSGGILYELRQPAATGKCSQKHTKNAKGISEIQINKHTYVHIIDWFRTK